MKKDILTLKDLSVGEIETLICRALSFKKGKKFGSLLKGKVLGLIFEKASTRTRVSFEVAMMRLGGQAIYLDCGATQIARGETIADTAQVLSRYLDGIVMRTYAQARLEEMASNASIPVINGLTDLHHPVQILTDLMTIVELKGSRRAANLKKCRISYVGDGNNMANSWIHAAMLLGFPLSLACPKGYWPDANLLTAADGFKNIHLTEDPAEAVEGSGVVNTDTWFSMGQEVSDEKRRLFEPYQVNRSLMAQADRKAIVLHCLPAHRGEEITDEVMDGPQSAVFDQAENRVWMQMAILEKLMGRKR
ncbi:MAG: ornithine carbamoyltransferase [Deltaproteobacteria bacterium]|nr:ornithine carbamoyltransferase [Deltaproteobacteria bacterium]